ncbi:MAG: glycosyltransferase, partial [Acidimicrobiia bacterium]
RYRRSLERLVHSLDLSHMVEFIDRYVDDAELFEMVRRSDVVVVPYDNHDQVSSGVITEAVGMARPVVATKFPYAVELLGNGAGLAVDHDVHSVARGIRELVEDPISYRHAAREAALKSAELSWGTVAERYSRLIHSLGPARATA